MNTQQTAPATKVITEEVRLSYANIWEPKADQQGEMKYSVAVLIPKSATRTLNAIRSACKACVEAKWHGKPPAKLKNPLRDGDDERPDDEVYAGHYFVNTTAKQQPGIVNAKVQRILDQKEVYSGCYARVAINFYAFDTAGNRGVGAGLLNIQKLRDGEPLGGRSRAEDDFDAVDDDNGFMS